MLQRILKLIPILVVLGIVQSPSLSAQTLNATNSVLLQDARLIVGDGSVVEIGSILITGDSIAAVGEVAADTLPENTQIINLQGKTVMPALIDAHAHLGYEGHSGWGARYYSRDNLIDHLQRYAYYGFAAVFSAGSDPEDLALALQRSQQRREFEGARLLFAAGMAPPGQGPNNQFLSHAIAVARQTGMTILRGLETPRQARQMVKEVAAKEIPFIKIWVDDRGGSQQKLHPELYSAVIDEATKNDIKVFVHQQFAEDMPDLLDAGVSGFLHGRIGDNFSDAITRQSKQAGVFIIPNLGLAELRREAIGEDEFLRASIPVAVAERLTGNSSQRRSNPVRTPDAEAELQRGFARLLNADVDIILGTDAGALPDHFFGYSGHRELEIFVRLGLTPMQALMAGTSKPAQRLGLNDLGLIRPGMSADLLVLNANPLDDIRNTRTITRVYLRGSEIDRSLILENMARRYNSQ
ncbi:MAG: hypothetical protein CMQ12_09160 [Gammaproteobacteria bacterium]|nr:hypothetical protein [Gammaproteobacteria bacterium]